MLIELDRIDISYSCHTRYCNQTNNRLSQHKRKVSTIGKDLRKAITLTNSRFLLILLSTFLILTNFKVFVFVSKYFLKILIIFDYFCNSVSLRIGCTIIGYVYITEGYISYLLAFVGEFQFQFLLIFFN